MNAEEIADAEQFFARVIAEARAEGFGIADSHVQGTDEEWAEARRALAAKGAA